MSRCQNGSSNEMQQTTSREDYLKKLADRRKASKAHTKHQLVGLVIAELLDDRTHKSLYIKIAKAHPKLHDRLLGYAKDVRDRHAVKQRGAYFMRIMEREGFLVAEKKQ